VVSFNVVVQCRVRIRVIIVSRKVVVMRSKPRFMVRANFSVRVPFRSVFGLSLRIELGLRLDVIRVRARSTAKV